MRYNNLFLLLLLIFTGCHSKKENDSVTTIDQTDVDLIYDLNASAKIIAQLIKQGRVSELLEDIAQEDIERFIKNTSPARIALEVEALSSQDPVILFFYAAKNDEYNDIHKKLIKIALTHRSIKCVEIDAEELFSLSHDAQINSLPTIIFIDKKEEIGRLDGDQLHELEKQLSIIIKDHV